MTDVRHRMTLAIAVAVLLLPHLAAADVEPVGVEFQVNTWGGRAGDAGGSNNR